MNLRKLLALAIMTTAAITIVGATSIHIPEPLVIKEMNACIREQIDSLPADYRAALVLHDLEGLTAAEVATVCDISLATAKIRIHRGRQRLRKVLANTCSFYYDDDLNLRCDRKLPDTED